MVGEDVLARRGVLAALDGEPGMVVVGEHRAGPGVYAAVVARQPDVLLLHGLRQEDSELVLTAVRRAGRKLRVLSIGIRDGEPEPVLDGLMCGALPPSATPEEVVAAVRIAAAGYALGRADEFGRLVHLPTGEHSREAAERDGLSDRECEVLALVAKRHVERRDRRLAHGVRAHGQVPRAEPVEQVEPAQPDPRGDLRLRDRAGLRQPAGGLGLPCG